jgi:hypothetical protein
LLVLEVFASSFYLSHPESHGPKRVGFFVEMGVQFGENRMGVKTILHQNFDDDSLLELQKAES